jgi:hypothetical protein
MTDIDHKALADAIRADRDADLPQWKLDSKRFIRAETVESAYLQLADERQSLLDRVKELEGERRWQSIETAPKDGTNILVGVYANTGEYQSFEPYLWVDSTLDGETWFVAPRLIEVPSMRPFFWMPLPRPPE